MTFLPGQPPWTRTWSLGSTTIGPPTLHDMVWTIPVDSVLQQHRTVVRLVRPATASVRAVVIVLPVQADLRTRFGDGLREVLAAGVIDTHRIGVAAPTFADSPWGVDHVNNPRLRQESNLIDVVTGVLDRALGTRIPRFAIGFSKGGYAAINLLLRHPTVFAGASVWDASMLRDRPTPDQLLAVAGTERHVSTYHVPTALREAAHWLKPSVRLALGGYGILRDDQRAAHQLLQDLDVDHIYYEGPRREHRWDSGWVPHALDAFTGLSTWPR